MNTILTQIEKLTNELSDQWKVSDSLVSQTIIQMTKLNLGLTHNFFELIKNGYPNAARIIARPIYERSVFLQYILHDRHEISSRALLFYHSSRLREFLWLKYILKDPETFKSFEKQYQQYQKQNKIVLKQQNKPLKKWVFDQIENEKQAFNRIEEMVNYCAIEHFDKDERRKTWYRIEPETFGGNLKISTLSDVSKFVLNDQRNYYYNLFYGIDSLYTHGYLISDIFDDNAGQFKIALLKLCLSNLQGLAKHLELNNNQQKQLDALKRKINSLRPIQTSQDLSSLEGQLDNETIIKQFKAQIEQNFDAYQFLVDHHHHYALHVLLRTLNEQIVSWKWMHQDHAEQRIQMFALTSQIQTISDFARLCAPKSAIQGRLFRMRTSKKDQYDELAKNLMKERSYRKDKQKRNWFILDNKNQTVHSMHQLERAIVDVQIGEFMYLYANGYMSVSVHGINLELPFKLNKETVFLLGGADQVDECHQVATKLWEIFKSEK